MKVSRRKLPYKVVDSINLAVLKRYRELASTAIGNIKTLLRTPSYVSDSERVLRGLVKSIKGNNGMAIFEQGEKVLVQVGEEWVGAEVLTSAGGLKVKREDGAVRVISDLAKIMKAPGESFGKGIFLEAFDVRILEGTKSFEIETRLDPITEQMNKTPLSVNKATWKKNLDKITLELAELTAKCVEISKDPTFKPNSPTSCFTEFKKRNMPMGEASKNGIPSFNKAILQHFANLGDDLAPVTIKAREAQSRLSQLEKWAPYATAGSVQTNWNQYGQPHGRYTADNPNLQNRVLEVRETVEAKDGFTFVSADWGMAEYVVWASLSKDNLLKSIFEEGRDLHKEMGASLAKIASPNGMEERKFGKLTNFALLYRMQPWTLAKTLGVTSDEAASILEEYYKKAPTASQYSNIVLKKAADEGFVETAFGRRLYCRDLRRQRGAPLHQLQKTVWHHHNAGTAAEMLKLKTLDVMDALLAKGIKLEDAHVALNMYDELILEVKNNQVDKVSKIMLEEMTKRVEGFLPFSVTIKTGKTWLDISK